MRDHYSIIHFLYQYFYRKLYFNSSYIFSPSDRMLNQIEVFLILLDRRYKLESIGINFLINYFIFQFDYWSNLEIKAFNGKINLSFIIGNKAFDRWLTRKTEFDWQLYQNEFVKNYKISTSYLKDFFKEDYSQDYINRFEELEKEKFYNTYVGFSNCISNTTLFNHRSKHCILCNHRQDCKILLQLNYQQIYSSRGY